MVIIGSVRPGARGQTVGSWVKKTIEADKRFELDYVDLKELDLPFYNEPAGGPNAIAYLGGGYQNPKGQKWADRVAKAEAYILVTPEYNHSYSAVLKNALDWVGPEWGGKAVTFVSYGYGNVAGTRAVEHLRSVVPELGMVQTKAALGIPGIAQAFKEDGTPEDDQLNDVLKTVLDSLYELGSKLQK